MRRLFTSESVTEGHPDKICDQISDSVLDAILEKDPNARVACETCTTTGMVMVMGEITTNCYVDIPKVVRETIREIGYDRAKYGFDCDTCSVMTAIDEQSSDIAMGVDEALESRQGQKDDVEAVGAGDQGMMFGYATNETEDFMPLSVALSHILLVELASIRREQKVMTYLRPDSKSQVTIEYDDNGYADRIHTIVLSTQHDEYTVIDGREVELTSEIIKEDIKKYLIPLVLEKYPFVRQYVKGDYHLLVNPTGKFVIGGPHGDTGLTGRKIIVDTYGGKGAHGGGAFSGKDPSKVDRSAAYAARHIAKNLVAAGVADEVLVQVAYAIGVAEPVSLYINTYGKSHVSLSDGEIAGKIAKIFDMRPYAIEQRLKLRNPIYEESASYGHVGRTPRTVTKHFSNKFHGDKTMQVELFTWEKLDYVEVIKKEFNL